MFPHCILTFLITRVSMPAAIFWTLAKTNHFLPKNICDLIRMILTMNNFSYNNEHYLQKHGTAMRTRMAPSYANLFIGKFEQQAIDNSLLKPFIWWRLIDDIFMIWTHGEEHLKSFIGFLNSIHPSIKFTHEYSNSLHQTLPRCPSSSHQQPHRNRSSYKAHRQTSIPPQNILPPKPHQNSHAIQPLPPNPPHMFYRHFLWPTKPRTHRVPYQTWI